jgi:DNA-binding NarL/FixJ family response regulator
LSSSSQSSLVAAAKELLSEYSQKPLALAQPLAVTKPAKIPESTTITNRSKRPSKMELAATLREIRHLLAEGYTNKEIIEMLQLESHLMSRNQNQN